MQSVSTDKLVRDAATEATMKISDFSIESSMRKDIYEALKNVQQNTPANSLDPESARLLERMLRDKRRAGLALPDDKQARFKELKTKISNKCIEFRKVGAMCRLKDRRIAAASSNASPHACEWTVDSHG